MPGAPPRKRAIIPPPPAPPLSTSPSQPQSQSSPATANPTNQSRRPDRNMGFIESLSIRTPEQLEAWKARNNPNLHNTPVGRLLNSAAATFPLADTNQKQLNKARLELERLRAEAAPAALIAEAEKSVASLSDEVTMTPPGTIFILAPEHQVQPQFSSQNLSDQDRFVLYYIQEELAEHGKRGVGGLLRGTLSSLYNIIDIFSADPIYQRTYSLSHFEVERKTGGLDPDKLQSRIAEFVKNRTAGEQRRVAKMQADFEKFKTSGASAQELADRKEILDDYIQALEAGKERLSDALKSTYGLPTSETRIQQTKLNYYNNIERRRPLTEAEKNARDDAKLSLKQIRERQQQTREDSERARQEAEAEAARNAPAAP